MIRNFMEENNQQIITPHRADLADLIIAKSALIKQDENLNFTYFFAVKPVYKFSVFVMLLAAFVIGFQSAPTKYYQSEISSQDSLIEDFYYSNYL